MGRRGYNCYFALSWQTLCTLRLVLYVLKVPVVASYSTVSCVTVFSLEDAFTLSMHRKEHTTLQEHS